MTPLLFYLFLALIGIICLLVDSFLNVVINYRLPIVMQRSRKSPDPSILWVFVPALFNGAFGADWWIVLGIILFVIYTFGYFEKRLPKFNHFLDRTLLKLPVVGIILNKSAIARFARTLSTMSAAGVPLVEALESAAGACGNIIYAEAVMKIREEVSMGQRLQAAMAQVGLFPQMVQQLIAIGEEAGSMDAMLAKVADLYEAEVDNLMNNLSSLESIIRVILGILVGGLIVAMYLQIRRGG